MAEYDALPDVGHACGHNLIAEASLGAAVAAMEAMKTTAAAKGKLVVLGTPAEESHGGKELLLQKGAFTDVDVAVMVHPIHQDSLRAGFNASQKITVRYRGKAAHAGACPWEGVNALDAAVASYVNVSLFRQQMKPACRVHGIFTESGKYSSVIADTSAILYHVRGETLDDLSELVTRLEGCFSAAAQATGCTMTTERSLIYKDVIHNMALTKTYRKHGIAFGVEFTDDDLSFIEPCGASTDAGNVSYEVPTIHPMYRILASGKNHTPAFAQASNSSEAQPPTLRVAKMLALTALDLFTDPALVSQAKAELADWKKARSREGCQTTALVA
ncbi:hypothetical protein V5799_028982 [Amblyomma americanum]|uniref:Peptidase M20 domain-containing protein 2 n=1 Tax=Amblyomma americanum TaxID=6943 RepID=A0AAQ4ESJ3_AMBAM